MKRESYRRKVWIGALMVVAFLSGCSTQADTQRSEPRMVPGGDAARGRQALLDYGCGSCHTIPGVPAADATVGPPLTDWADRHFIAGSLANEPENLIHWIRFPQEIEPGTAMPNTDVDEQTARDMSAYLFTLQRDGDDDLWPFGTENR